jgi:hypothetical protein
MEFSNRQGGWRIAIYVMFQGWQGRQRLFLTEQKTTLLPGSKTKKTKQKNKKNKNR